MFGSRKAALSDADKDTKVPNVRFPVVGNRSEGATAATGVYVKAEEEIHAPWRPPPINTIPTEDEIRALAYTLWQANPESDSTANWLEAERILTNMLN
jgi:hypothetical protein